MSDNFLDDLPDASPFLEGDPLAPEAPSAPETVTTDTVVVNADPLAATPEASKTPQAGVPRKVVEALRAERRTLREELAANKEQLAAATASAATAKELAQVLQGVDPARVQWDQRYMNALESLAQRDPNFAKLAQQVQAAMEDPSLSNVNPQFTAQPQAAPEQREPAAFATDPRLDAIFERESASHVRASLDGIAPEFQELFANLVLGNTDDPLSLSRHDVRALAADYARENGFKPEQYLSAPEPKRPHTGGGQRAVPTPGPAPDPVGADGKLLAQPKSMAEWQAGRQARMRAAFNR